METLTKAKRLKSIKQNGAVWRVIHKKIQQNKNIVILNIFLPQLSSIPRLLLSRRQQWLQHVHGLLCGFSNVDEYDRQGTIDDKELILVGGKIDAFVIN